MATKRNRKIAGIIVFLFVAGFFSWQNSGIWQESQLKPQRLETPESEFDRYDIKDGHFTVAEANANIVKEINRDEETMHKQAYVSIDGDKIIIE